MQKILIASDHAGFLLKESLIKKLKDNFDFEDLGTKVLNPLIILTMLISYQKKFHQVFLLAGF